jgi:uncharacterized protein (TIGR03083 family)
MSEKDHIKSLLEQEWRELLELSRQLSAEEWNTPSLCEGWTVRDVLAHILGEQRDSLLYFTSGSPHKANQKAVDKRKNLPISSLIEELESVIVKPGILTKVITTLMLEDNWVHQQDMRWVLDENRQRQQKPEKVLQILTVLNKTALKKYPGVKFQATDLDWSIGEGKEVRGTGEAVAMFLARRPVALKKLEGDGLALLKK